MQYSAKLAILAAMLFLTACNTTTRAPDISSVQPTPYDEQQAKLQSALKS